VTFNCVFCTLRTQHFHDQYAPSSHTTGTFENEDGGVPLEDGLTFMCTMCNAPVVNALSLPWDCDICEQSNIGLACASVGTTTDLACIGLNRAACEGMAWHCQQCGRENLLSGAADADAVRRCQTCSTPVADPTVYAVETV
jgi:hypothetical protein